LGIKKLSEKNKNTTFLSNTDFEHIFPIIYLIKILLKPVIILISLIRIPLIFIDLNSFALIIISTICFLLHMKILAFFIFLVGFLLSIISEELHFKGSQKSNLESKKLFSVISTFSLLGVPLLAIGLLRTESMFFPWLILLSFLGSTFYTVRQTSLYSSPTPINNSYSKIKTIILCQLILNSELRTRNRLGSSIFFTQMNICSINGILFFAILASYLFFENLSLVLLTVMIISQFIITIVLILGFIFFKRPETHEQIK
jgi:hypothetical protein